MRAPVEIFLAFVVGLNLLSAIVQIGLLRRHRPRPRGLAVFIVLWAVVMSGLAILQIEVPDDWRATARHWLYLPLAVSMVWNLLMLQFWVLGLLLATLALRIFRPVRAEARAITEPGISRRRFVYLLGCGTLPATAVGLGVHGSLTRYDLRVRRFDIPITGLPPELVGYTIAHVSDLHSGIFCGPRRLARIRDATNDLQADLIAVTGDLINHDLSEFSDVLVALQGLHRVPYLCEGNHDTLAGDYVIGRACREQGLPWLYNQSVILPVRGRRLILGGLPWMNRGFEGRPEIVRRLYPARQPGDVRILMAHHPHLFDIAEDADLVLAGHTHGGQIMAGDDLGLGPLFFRYWSGLYRRDNTTLIVSNGCGDWFPCRVGAPAEIGLLRLMAA